MTPRPNPILLYDGVCGLCNRLVQFILRHDHNDAFRFASLQSARAEEMLKRHDVSAADLDTFYVIADPGQPSERLFARSDAVAYVLSELGGIWKVVGWLWNLLPRYIRDALYNLVARHRYQVFGRLSACPLPDPRNSNKFLEG
ncbi:MAG: DCC1-like thiol-disulfide oxidoreductase family protein [Terriglobales bacterium]